jgi:indole-3-glycerol phosphate synthase
MAEILRKIYEAKAVRRERDSAIEPYEVLRERALARRGERRPFEQRLRSAPGLAIVAEIKRASPSAGLIARNFDPVAIAVAYENSGADAISVITEQDHFLGELAFLDAVRPRTSKPMLRKDFLATRYDIVQSAAYGADCVLLITGWLDDVELRDCIDEARAYDLDVLIEVHDEAELERAVALGATLVGINNRDLRTFETDLAVSEQLLPYVPAHIFALSESGMRDAGDVDRLRAAGAHGFLIGESLMRSEDPAALIAALKAAVPTP